MTARTQTKSAAKFVAKYEELTGLWHRIGMVQKPGEKTRYVVDDIADVNLGGQNGFFAFLNLARGRGDERVFCVTTGTKKGMWIQVQDRLYRGN